MDEPRVSIRFCCKCRWWLRAGWMAQELFSTFGEQLSVELQPGEGGEFTIRAGGELLWDRRRDGGFPEAKELKRLVREALFPERDIGHNEPTGPS